LFISTLESKELATVAINNLRSLFLAVGESSASPDQWSELMEQLSLLFQASQPKLLVTEMQNF